MWYLPCTITLHFLNISLTLTSQYNPSSRSFLEPNKHSWAFLSLASDTDPFRSFSFRTQLGANRALWSISTAVRSLRSQFPFDRGIERNPEQTSRPSPGAGPKWQVLALSPALIRSLHLKSWDITKVQLREQEFAPAATQERVLQPAKNGGEGPCSWAVCARPAVSCCPWWVFVRRRKSFWIFFGFFPRGKFNAERPSVSNWVIFSVIKLCGI